VEQLFLLAHCFVFAGLDCGDHHSLAKGPEDFPKGILAGFILYFI
jgi:hypothetical protein